MSAAHAVLPALVVVAVGASAGPCPLGGTPDIAIAMLTAIVIKPRRSVGSPTSLKKRPRSVLSWSLPTRIMISVVVGVGAFVLTEAGLG